MASTLSSARRALKAPGPRGQTTRIPESVRGVVLAYVREARRIGETWAGIAENVGLSETALHRWHRGGQKKFLPVVVSKPPLQEMKLTLTTAGGERLEGLSLQDAVQIVKALR
jgi:hypothetical protein